MKDIGIDYSISSPALAAYHNGRYTVVGFSPKKSLKSTKTFQMDGNGTLFTFIVHPYPEWSNPQERYHKLADALLAPVSRGDNVAIEGYAMGVSGGKGRIFDIAEACQTAKSELYRECGIVPTPLAPGTIKKHATGDGRASKIPMLEAFKIKFGFDPASVFGDKPLSHPAEDMVDAVWIAELARSLRNG